MLCHTSLNFNDHFNLAKGALMGFFSKIFSKIFPSANAAEIVVAPPPAPAAATAPAAPAVPPSIPMGDVAPILDAMPGASALNWRTSIVDLLKLLGLDSSLSARKELAGELFYSGSDEPGSAAWNIWLHKQVMRSIAANGGSLPPNCATDSPRNRASAGPCRPTWQGPFLEAVWRWWRKSVVCTCHDLTFRPPSGLHP